MNKKTMILMTFLVASQFSFCQNVDKLFAEFSKISNVENVHLGKFFTTIMKPFAKQLKRVDSIKVLDMSECSADAKESFNKSAKNIKDNKYETLLSVNEEGQTVQILMKMKKKSICELIVITTGEDCCLVKVKGDFKQSDIQPLINR